MRHLLVVLVAAFAISSVGCGGTRFMAKDEGAPRTPPAGKALVNFIRPSAWASGEDLPIFDGMSLVGNVQGKMVFPYVCEPGEHWFFGNKGHVSAVHADLLPDKTYDILIDIAPGAWGANVFLSPVTVESHRRGQIAQWDASLPRYSFKADDDAKRFEAKRSAEMSTIIADFRDGGKFDRVKPLEKTDHR